MERKIDTLYWLGDKVWIIVQEFVEEKCLACEGEGTVKLKDRKIYECPNCRGNGLSEDSKEILKIRGGTIDEITLGIKEGNDTYKETYHIFYEDDDGDFIPCYCSIENICKSKEEAKNLLEKKERG